MVRRTKKLVLVLVVVALVAAGICDVSGASTRDKKKNKTRSDIVTPTNETAAGAGAGEKGTTIPAAAAAANVTVVDVAVIDKELETTNSTAVLLAVDKDKDVVVEVEVGEEAEVAPAPGHSDSDKDVVVILDEDKLEEMEASNGLETAKPKPHSYMTRIKNLLKRVLDLLGLTRSKRKSRVLSFNHDNSLDSTRADYYTEEVRATVGALLGKRDCLRRAVCGAGSYLRHIKGKEVVIIVLEKIVPSAWKDSLNFIKEAAIYQDRCDYKCVDEDDD